jgi:hypothetical protein
MFIPDPDFDFYPSRIPDPGVKKASDPGSATLHGTYCKVKKNISQECTECSKYFKASLKK